jgi:hypothetical protein
MNAVPPVRHGTDQDIKEAVNIYRDFTARCKRDAEFIKLSAQDKLSYYHNNSPEVVKKFPVIFRYMVETGQFNPTAMNRYINKLKAKPYKNEEEYCERNADYVKYLYMSTHTHYNQKESARLWVDTKKSLMGELKDFKNNLDKYRKQNDDMNEANANERKEELKHYIEKMQTEQSTKIIK